MVTTAAGLGLGLSALSIQFRDIGHATGFTVQLLMYATPVVYPSTLVPELYQLIYARNPMVGVVEGFRAALLGVQPVPWTFIAIGSAVALLLLGLGLAYFKRREHLFADVA